MSESDRKIKDGREFVVQYFDGFEVGDPEDRHQRRAIELMDYLDFGHGLGGDFVVIGGTGQPSLRRTLAESVALSKLKDSDIKGEDLDFTGL